MAMDTGDSSERAGNGQTGAPDILLGAADPNGTRLFFTTNPGLESVVESELAQRLQEAEIGIVQVVKKPFGFGGQVLAECEGHLPSLEAIVLQMRSVHHVQIPLHGFALLYGEHDLRQIERELEALTVGAMVEAKKFRVTTKRTGHHLFTSMDVQRAAGTVLQRKYGCAVDLENHDVNIRVDVYDRICLVGLQLSKKALSNRYRRRSSPRAALKAPVAYALLQWAQLRPDAKGALLDPFCGSGTILIEAAQLYPHLELHGVDIDARAVEGTRVNAAAEGIEDRLHLSQGDARKLSAAYPAGRFGAIVTNPPYGIRFGQHLNFYRFYRRILQECWTLLDEDGMLVIIVFKRTEFYRGLVQLGLFKTIEERVVETGGIFPAVYVLQKVAAADQPAIE